MSVKLCYVIIIAFIPYLDQWIISECGGTPSALFVVFTFANVDQHTVVLFEGRQCEGGVNELHILSMKQ